MRPRPIVPGKTYLITRTCIDQQFLLKPSPLVKQVFLYCMAVAASRTGVKIHASTVESNHYHNVVSDPLGKIPEFDGYLNEFVTRALNRKRRRRGAMWQPNEQINRVELLDNDAIVKKMVYTASNPVKDLLVEHGSLWPGIRVFKPTTMVIKRPEGFFRENGGMPEEVTLEIHPPPLTDSRSDEATVKRIEYAVLAEEDRIRREAKRKGKKFLGVARIMKQRITDRPRNRRRFRRGKIAPTVACRDKWRRIERLEELKQWRADYRDSLGGWRSGDRDVVFPPGTYAMVRFHNARAAEPKPAPSA